MGCFCFPSGSTPRLRDDVHCPAPKTSRKRDVFVPQVVRTPIQGTISIAPSIQKHPKNGIFLFPEWFEPPFRERCPLSPAPENGMFLFPQFPPNNGVEFMVLSKRLRSVGRSRPAMRGRGKSALHRARRRIIPGAGRSLIFGGPTCRTGPQKTGSLRKRVIVKRWCKRPPVSVVIRAAW